MASMEVEHESESECLEKDSETLQRLTDLLLRGRVESGTTESAKKLFFETAAKARARSEGLDVKGRALLAQKGVAAHNAIRNFAPGLKGGTCSREVAAYLRGVAAVLVSLSPSEKVKDHAQICLCLARAGVGLLDSTTDTEAALAALNEAQQHFQKVPQKFWRHDDPNGPVGDAVRDDLLLTMNHCLIYKTEALRASNAAHEVVLGAFKELKALLALRPLPGLVNTAADHLMAHGKICYRKGEYTESIEFLEMAIEVLDLFVAENGSATSSDDGLALKPENQRRIILQALSNCYAKTGDFAAATSALDACLALIPPTDAQARADALLCRIKTLIVSGQTESAGDSYKLLLQTGDYDHALEGAVSIAQATNFRDSSIHKLGKLVNLSYNTEQGKEASVVMLEALLRAHRLRWHESHEGSIGKTAVFDLEADERRLAMARDLCDGMASSARNEAPGGRVGMLAPQISLEPAQAVRVRRAILGFVDAFRFSDRWKEAEEWCARAIDAHEGLLASDGGEAKAAGLAKSVLLKLYGIRGEVLCAKLGQHDQGQEWLLKAVKLVPTSPVAQRAPLLCMMRDARLSEPRVKQLLADIPLPDDLAFWSDVTDAMAAALKAACAGKAPAKRVASAIASGSPVNGGLPAPSAEALVRCVLLLLERWTAALTPHRQAPDATALIHDDSSSSRSSNPASHKEAANVSSATTATTTEHLEAHAPKLLHALSVAAYAVVTQTSFPDPNKNGSGTTLREERRHQMLLERLLGLCSAVLDLRGVCDSHGGVLQSLQQSLVEVAQRCSGGIIAASDGDPYAAKAPSSTWLGLSSLYYQALAALSKHVEYPSTTHAKEQQLRFTTCAVAACLESVQELRNVGGSIPAFEKDDEHLRKEQLESQMDQLGEAAMQQEPVDGAEEELPKRLCVEHYLCDGNGAGPLSMACCRQHLEAAHVLLDELSKTAPELAAEFTPTVLVEAFNVCAFGRDSAGAIHLLTSREASFVALQPNTLDLLLTIANRCDLDKPVVKALCRIALKQHRPNSAASPSTASGEAHWPTKAQSEVRSLVSPVYVTMLSACTNHTEAFEVLEAAAEALSAAEKPESGSKPSEAGTAAAGTAVACGGFADADVANLAGTALNGGIISLELQQPAVAVRFLTLGCAMVEYANEAFKAQHFEKFHEQLKVAQRQVAGAATVP